MKDPFSYFWHNSSFDEKKEISTKFIYSNLESSSVKYSIVIPTYRRPQFIRETILSAIRQTYSQDYEVLIISDGQYPEEYETEKIIRELGNCYSGLSYYRNTANVGMFCNWNRCAEYVKGQWVIILPDDDMLSPHYLEKIDDFIINHNYKGMIGVNYHKISDEENYEQVFFPDISKNDTVTKIALNDIYLGAGINVTGMAIHRQTLIDFGGFKPQFYPIADSVCLINFAAFSNLVNIKDDLAAYRVGSNISLSSGVMDEIIHYTYQIRETIAMNQPFIGKFHYFFEKEYLYMYLLGAEKYWNIELNKRQILAKYYCNSRVSSVKLKLVVPIKKMLKLINSKV